jgi:hypothetical protein
MSWSSRLSLSFRLLNKTLQVPHFLPTPGIWNITVRWWRSPV